MPRDYSTTLNLPETDFSVRSNLSQKEQDILKRWKECGLYNKIIEKNEGKPSFILHDGPPYANGDISIGHAFNKCLKDFVVRSKNQSGFCSPFVPGYDTHGLPIEGQAIKKQGLDRRTSNEVEFRTICKDFALHYAKNQFEQFERLGVFGDRPYYTLSPDFEATQIRIFGEMAKRGYIYKGLRPVYWCPHDETALAEAELEYGEEPCQSVYVKFKLLDDDGKILEATGLKDIYFIVWTNAIWTLPGNAAICLNKNLDYSIIETGGNGYIVASELSAEIMSIGGAKDYRELLRLKGGELEYMKTEHPFLPRTVMVVLGEQVTIEIGTGCAHIAGGHGVTDYEICQKYGLQILMLVDDRGQMTEAAGEICDKMATEDANFAILKHMEHMGCLYGKKKMTYKYPHCWHCKTPILFKVTEQWFCSVEEFREQILKAIEDVNWLSASGREIISAMVHGRSDWCISRQRLWGVPLPIFYCGDCGKYIVDDITIDAVAELFERDGGNSWYVLGADSILPRGYKCPHCGGIHFTKEHDIMDVWFDSGSSHVAILKSEKGLKWPADLYLESAEQYQGWFLSSLLTAVATMGAAPYKSVLASGFVVNGRGEKMSKALGNEMEPGEIIDRYGADILRLWAASTNCTDNIPISEEIIKEQAERYKKVRNTARFILGNLKDFNPDVDMVDIDQMRELERQLLHQFSLIVEVVKNAYDSYSFHVVCQTIYDFCTEDLSAFYLNTVKERLYCEEKESFERRSVQSALFMVLEELARLISPILCYAAEEIWSYLPTYSKLDMGSVSLNDFPKARKIENINAEKWKRIKGIREDVKKALEQLQINKTIVSSIEAGVRIYCSGEEFSTLNSLRGGLETILTVSRVEVFEAGKGEAAGDKSKIQIQVYSALGEQCKRCHRVGELSGDSECSELCKRCAEVVKNLQLERRTEPILV